MLEYDPALKWSKPGENSHSHLDSNAADSIFNVTIKGVPTLPGIHRNNVAGVPIAPMLVDPAARNFRPKGGSAVHVLGAGAKHTLWEPFAIFETKKPSFYQDRLETNLRKT